MLLVMIVKCKHCGRQNKLPTTGKAEDYETKIFKCSSCKKPLFSKAEVAKYNPRPLKTHSTQQKTETPKSKSQPYKPSPKNNSAKVSSEATSEQSIKEEITKLTQLILKKAELKLGEPPAWMTISLVVLVSAIALGGAFWWLNKGSYEECFIEYINSAPNAKAAQIIRRDAEDACLKKYPFENPFDAPRFRGIIK